MPDIDLTGITVARLTFPAVVNAASGDSLLGTFNPFTTLPANAASQNLDLALPATADDNTIYLEFRFQGASEDYHGFCLNDVAGNAP